jgi:hypothetical protein
MLNTNAIPSSNLGRKGSARLAKTTSSKHLLKQKQEMAKFRV